MNESKGVKGKEPPPAYLVIAQIFHNAMVREVIVRRQNACQRKTNQILEVKTNIRTSHNDDRRNQMPNGTAGTVIVGGASTPYVLLSTG